MGRSRRTVERLALSVRYKEAMFKLAGLPVVSTITERVLDRTGTSFTLVPVYETVERGGSTAMPLAVAEHFIDSAAHHVILDRCLCRNAVGCRDYPIGHGCIFVGRGAREIDPGVGRHVSREEALAHLRGGVELGLLPAVGKVDIDALILGVKDRGRLLTICLCCPCCCLTTALHHASKGVRDMISRMEGLEVAVTGGCSGCGKCVEACIYRQMSLEGGRAVVGPECKGCGRCAAACPEGAISITLQGSDYLQACIDRIGAVVDVG